MKRTAGPWAGGSFLCGDVYFRLLTNISAKENRNTFALMFIFGF